MQGRADCVRLKIHDHRHLREPSPTVPNPNRRSALLLSACLTATLPLTAAIAAVDEAQARKAGEAAVQTVIPRKMDYKSLKLGFLPFSAKVSDLTISENERFARHPLRDWKHFYTAREISLTADLLPLLIGRISVTKLDIRDFQANVLVDRDYTLNVGDLMQQKRGPLMNWLRVKNFHASGGSVRVVDATAARGPARLVFDDIDARFTGFAIKDKFQLNVGLRTPGAKTRNVSLRGVAGPILDTVRSEQVPLDGVLTVDQAPILPFSAYIPDGLTAYPESGTASMKLQLQGNAWDGMTSKGGIRLENLVMVSRDGTLRGKPFTMALDIGRNVVSLKQQQVAINNMAVSMGGNRLTLDGMVRGIPRTPVIDIDLRAPAIDLAAMEEIYPFFRAYLPKGLQFNGTAALDIHAKGDMQAMASTGKLDVSGLGLFLAEVFEKKPGADLKVDFSANLTPKDFTIKAKANVTGRDLVLLNAWLFRDGLKLALGNRVPVRVLDSVIRPSEKLTAGGVRGAMDYDNGFVSFRNFAADSLSDPDGPVMDTLISGSFDLNRLVVRWDVSARLSAVRSQKLLKASPGLAALMDADGRLPFRFKVEGPMHKLRVFVQAETMPPGHAVLRRLPAVGSWPAVIGVR